jgi:hypothetical protein
LPDGSQLRSFNGGVGSFFSKGDAKDDSGGNANGYAGKSEPIVVKDDNVKRPDRKS